MQIMKKNYFIKISWLLFAIVGLLFSPVLLKAQPLFSISHNHLPKEILGNIYAQMTKSEISALELTKNKREKDIYRIVFSSPEDTHLLVLNKKSGAHIVITPASSSISEFQLATFFIEELKQGELGDAEHFLVLETNADYEVKNIFSVSTNHGSTYIPRYFYGERENIQEALPRDRQIISISKMKPRYIPYNPKDPENVRFAAELGEANYYYIYVFKLPDGTITTFDENMIPNADN